VPTADAKIYLVTAGHLVPVSRSVPAPLSVGTVLAALVQGATRDESAKGYVSSVGPQASVLSAQVMDNSAVIDISDSFSGIGVQEQIAGLAQIVYTATELPGIQNVKVQLNSRSASVPRGDGSATAEPLTRADYASLAPQ
jgi:spore germination protein GerM